LSSWTWPGQVATFRKRMLSTAAVLGVAIAGIALACMVVGLGPGWITALKSTGKVNDTYSPTTKIGFSISELLGAVGVHVDGALLAGGVRILGLAATGVLALVMMLRSPRIGIVRATGIMLVAYVLLWALTPQETADLATLPSQTKRAAILLHRLGQGAAGL